MVAGATEFGASRFTLLRLKIFERYIYMAYCYFYNWPRECCYDWLFQELYNVKNRCLERGWRCMVENNRGGTGLMSVACGGDAPEAAALATDLYVWPRCCAALIPHTIQEGPQPRIGTSYEIQKQSSPNVMKMQIICLLNSNISGFQWNLNMNMKLQSAAAWNVSMWNIEDYYRKSRCLFGFRYLKYQKTVSQCAGDSIACILTWFIVRLELDLFLQNIGSIYFVVSSTIEISDFVKHNIVVSMQALSR